MKKINNYIENNIQNILMIYLFIQPIIDVLTNIVNTSITIGMIIRVIFMIFCIYYLIFIDKSKNILKYLISLFIYFILFIIINYLYKGNLIIFAEIKEFIRCFYFPVVILFIYKLKKEKINNKYLYLILLIYLLFIIIPSIFLDINSYDVSKIGEKGLFYSTNEVSVIISILFPILLYFILKDKNDLLYKFIISILYLIATLIIGTKSTFITLIISILVFFIYFIINKFKKSIFKIIFNFVILLILGISSIFIILPKTSFYKNIKMHMDYFNINHVSDIFKTFDNFDNIIFSDRLTFLSDRAHDYKNSTFANKFYGIGSYKLLDDEIKVAKSVEIDYFDVFLQYGIIGFLLFFIPFIYIIYKQFKINLLFFLELFLIFFLALFSGHVFISPAVSIFVAFIICMDYKNSIN